MDQLFNKLLYVIAHFRIYFVISIMLTFVSIWLCPHELLWVHGDKLLPLLLPEFLEKFGEIFISSTIHCVTRSKKTKYNNTIVRKRSVYK